MRKATPITTSPPATPAAEPPREAIAQAPNRTPPCPRCKYGSCPCKGGSKGGVYGRRQYRECARCGHVFRTLVPHASLGGKPNPLGLEERLDA